MTWTQADVCLCFDSTPGHQLHRHCLREAREDQLHLSQRVLVAQTHSGAPAERNIRKPIARGGIRHEAFWFEPGRIGPELGRVMESIRADQELRALRDWIPRHDIIDERL